MRKQQESAAGTVVITQHVTATVVAGGSDRVDVDTHGAGGPGSYITVATQNVIVWLYTRRAATCYANAWLDGVAAETAHLLPPADRPLTVPPRADHYPTVGVRAHGADTTKAIYLPARRELAIQIGYVTWLVRDLQSYTNHQQAWLTVGQLAPIVLPPH